MPPPPPQGWHLPGGGETITYSCRVRRSQLAEEASKEIAEERMNKKLLKKGEDLKLTSKTKAVELSAELSELIG